MKLFTIYDTTTGVVINGGTVANDGDVALQVVPPGAAMLVGKCGVPGRQKVQAGELVDVDPQQGQ